jgi:hypothetical protein
VPTYAPTWKSEPAISPPRPIVTGISGG